MATYKVDEHLRSEWLRLVQAGLTHRQAYLEVGTTKGIASRWSKELGLCKCRGPMPRQRTKRKATTKNMILDRLFASPLGGYPNFLNDYQAAV